MADPMMLDFAPASVRMCHNIGSNKIVFELSYDADQNAGAAYNEAVYYFRRFDRQDGIAIVVKPTSLE